MHEGIEQLFKMRKRFAIIGLTGRTGSGCTTVAKTLKDISTSLDAVSSHVETKGTSFEKREWGIIYNFYKKNEIEFYHIQIKNIISTFILEYTYEECKNFLQNNYNINIEHFHDRYIEFYNKNKILDRLTNGESTPEEFAKDNPHLKQYLFDELSSFTEELKEFIDSQEKCSTDFFQTIGDNIRKTGCAFQNENGQFESVFSIARRTNSLIKVIRRINKNNIENEPHKFSFFIIDAFRNPLEIHFFREKLSAFYLIAINCTDEKRNQRLLNKNLTHQDIHNIDDKEKGKGNFYTNYDSYIGQDIKECVNMAGLYINNTDSPNPCRPDLTRILTRYMVLIQHPGIVKPTRHEFLMQIAVNAATNSGCISRNVGAVITDNSLDLLAVGWNCVPHMQVPCSARDISNLVSCIDETAYSIFEKSDNFREQLKNNNRAEKFKQLEETGLPKNYCFKTEYNNITGVKNQVHTRALHAEENAILQCAEHGRRADQGYLFTSSSPCVLCAKKISQLGIKEVFYMDPYPDISENHVFGYPGAEVKMTLFTGAVGVAYHKLYTSLLPMKDEIEAIIMEKLV